MSTKLQQIKDSLQKELFTDPIERRKNGLCVACGEPAVEKCYSNAGRREYGISGMCEMCFDGLFDEEEEN